MESKERRTFLEVAFLSLTGLGKLASAQTTARPVYVEHGADRFKHPYTIAGANEVAFKVAAQDTHDGLFIIEQVSQRKGGPPRHMHHAQEEWFYILEGEYVFEVGEQRIRMGPGDSLIGPRGVPHVWAYVGEKPGKIIIGFAPAGQMEKFFVEAAQLRDFAADQKLYRECGMDIVGPPLPLA
jgi:quercetin 2,3-dioxygenase